MLLKKWLIWIDICIRLITIIIIRWAKRAKSDCVVPIRKLVWREFYRNPWCVARPRGLARRGRRSTLSASPVLQFPHVNAIYPNLRAVLREHAALRATPSGDQFNASDLRAHFRFAIYGLHDSARPQCAQEDSLGIWFYTAFYWSALFKGARQPFRCFSNKCEINI